MSNTKATVLLRDALHHIQANPDARLTLLHNTNSENNLMVRAVLAASTQMMSKQIDFLNRLLKDAAVMTTEEHILEIAKAARFSDQFFEQFSKTHSDVLKHHRQYCSGFNLFPSTNAVILNGRIVELTETDSWGAGDFRVFSAVESSRVSALKEFIGNAKLELPADEQTRFNVTILKLFLWLMHHYKMTTKYAAFC